jgi:hypothetical protein
MSLKTQMNIDLTSVFFNSDEFAETCSYTDFATKTKVTGLKCIVQNKAEVSTEYGRADYSTVVVRFKDIALPQRNDKIETDTATYTVLNRVSLEFGAWTLQVESEEKSKP